MLSPATATTEIQTWPIDRLIFYGRRRACRNWNEPRRLPSRTDEIRTSGLAQAREGSESRLRDQNPTGPQKPLLPPWLAIDLDVADRPVDEQKSRRHKLACTQR
jgi:hypothetical protein